MMRDVINRAAAMGVPVKPILTDTEQSARISSMFTMIPVTFSDQSFAAVFTDLIGMVPDAAAWWDYAVDPPALCVTRRDEMTALSYAVGATGSIRVTRCDIAPRLDLNVRRMELKYIQRDATTGKTIFRTQAAGVPAAELTPEDRRRTQIIVISGPEKNDFVPKDDIESVVIQTQQVRLAYEWALKFDETIKSIVAAVGEFPGGKDDMGPIPNAYLVTDSSDDVTDWLKKEQNIKTSDVRVVGWIKSGESSTGGYGSAGTELMKMGRLKHYPTQNYYMMFVDFTVPVINVSIATKTRFYKRLAYQYRKPHDGLAADLRDARNFTPWEGTVELTRPDLSGFNAIQRKLNITNSHPDHASMNAMIRSVTYNGAAHTLTFGLGGPARTSLGGLVNRAKRSGKENFDYL